MVDQPPDSDLYMTPAAKTHADKFVAEMRALHFPVPRVQADGCQDVAFEWSNKLRLVITATVAEFSIVEQEKNSAGNEQTPQSRRASPRRAITSDN
jgi:hypothetical protein